MPKQSLVTVKDYEENALKTWNQQTINFIQCGADEEKSLKESTEAFSRWRLRPKMLRGSKQVDTQTSVLGTPVSMPILAAVPAIQKLAHHEGEMGTGRACAKADVVMGLSCWSSTSIEEVATVHGLKKWMQLQLYKGNLRDVTLDLIRRAEKAGFLACVVTIDMTAYMGKRPKIHEGPTKHCFEIPPDIHLANYPLSLVSELINTDLSVMRTDKDCQEIDHGATWTDLKWIKDNTKMKVVAKGVMSGEDACLALDVGGVDAIWVSNHGGRQLDTTLATIDVLPEIVKAVNGRCEVYMDGGIRLGSDVFKALALGARAVFIGRPIMWGLAYDGGEGVFQVLEILREELLLTMALSGCRNLDEITRDYVVHINSYLSQF